MNFGKPLKMVMLTAMLTSLDQFFMELDKLAQMQWLNVLENGEFHVYSFC